MSEVDVKTLARGLEIRIVPTSEGDYEVQVPELEAVGCHVITGGETHEEALANALESVECAIQGRLADGLPLPLGAVR